MVTRRALGVAVSKGSADLVKRSLVEVGLLERSLRPLRLDDEVVFPLISEEGVAERASEILGVQVSEFEFEAYGRRPATLKESLSGVIPRDLLARVPSSYDVIGDIAILRVPPELYEFRHLIARSLLDVNPSVRSIFMETSKVEGTFRVRGLEHIGGEERTRTVYRENGCVFHVDVDRVYFSPRLSTERARVVKLAKRGEVVVDMFAGVGPFSIELAKHKGAKVFASEVNEAAYGLLLLNLAANKVERNVEAFLGDARDIFRKKADLANRVIMNHPSDSLSFLDVALRLTVEGGTVHVYGFASDEAEWTSRVSEKVRHIDEGAVIDCRVSLVREVSPRRGIYVMDLRLLHKTYFV
ncbi:MAG: class I SAM-dependent methyltransferase family protein [Aigarchaeota archaeon]|nr:class I SAM-dependent methyltransferase family protein [Aigarchaeota archaeon]MDW8092588.1 class I SAM-dependent methyltransferase family protein [Nitrososphaerota archaeon]